MGVNPIRGLILVPLNGATGVSYSRIMIRYRQEPESTRTLSKVSSPRSLVASYPKSKLMVSTPYRCRIGQVEVAIKVPDNYIPPGIL